LLSISCHTSNFSQRRRSCESHVTVEETVVTVVRHSFEADVVDFHHTTSEELTHHMHDASLSLLRAVGVAFLIVLDPSAFRLLAMDASVVAESKVQN